MKLSIIIPVYQAEKTLARCLDSILDQHVPDIEIILIDDGSTDTSPAICNEYAERYSYFKIIHKENEGASIARNTGIDMASGDYITFIDCDDFLSPHTYAPIMNIAKEHPEYDIIEYSIIEKLNEHTLKPFLIFENNTYNDMGEYWLNSKAYLHTFVWNKIYRQSVWEGIRFVSGKEPFEDYANIISLLPKCRNIHTTSVGQHIYDRTNENSLSHSATGREYTLLLQDSIKMLNKYADKSFFKTVLNIQIITYELTLKAPLLREMPYYDSMKLLLMHLLGMKRFCQAMCSIRKLIGKTPM